MAEATVFLLDLIQAATVVMTQLQSPMLPHPSDLQPLLSATKKLFQLLPNDELLKHTVLAFIHHLEEDVTAAEVLQLLLHESIFSNKGLREDIKGLLEALGDANHDQPIPENAFMTAALLLLVSYLTDSWPFAIVTSQYHQLQAWNEHHHHRWKQLVCPLQPRS